MSGERPYRDVTRVNPGRNIKDWVKHWTPLAIDEINTGCNTADEFFWTTISKAFEQAFQDTGATECAEEKFRHLSFTPGEVDTFIARFESLANEANYQLDARSTITLFASKLPYRMMDHLYKIVCPHDFAGWVEGVCQHRQDNQAVQNIKDIHGDTPKKFPQKKTGGFMAAYLTKILGVKMPSPNPDAMDTWAYRNRSANRNW